MCHCYCLKWVSVDMGMDQYLLIPFLGGWTSIYQLFWSSLGARVLTHPQIILNPHKLTSEIHQKLGFKSRRLWNPGWSCWSTSSFSSWKRFSPMAWKDPWSVLPGETGNVEIVISMYGLVYIYIDVIYKYYIYILSNYTSLYWYMKP